MKGVITLFQKLALHLTKTCKICKYKILSRKKFLSKLGVRKLSVFKKNSTNFVKKNETKKTKLLNVIEKKIFFSKNKVSAKLSVSKFCKNLCAVHFQHLIFQEKK